MSIYGSRLRGEKRVELTSRVAASIVEDIWCMSYMVTDAEEFVDYLMTITDEQAIEEFFNQCHDQGGRFCEGDGGTSSSFKKPISGHAIVPSGHAIVPKGKVTKHGLKLDYAAQDKVYDIINTHRNNNPKFKAVTRPTSIKLNKLAKTKLSTFKTEELTALHTLAGMKQHENKVWSRVSLGIAAVLVGVTGNPLAAPFSTTFFVADSIQSKRYKTQGERLRKELTKRGTGSLYLSTESDWTEEFAAAEGLSDEDRALLLDFKKMLDELINDNDGDYDESEIVDLKNLRAAADKV